MVWIHSYNDTHIKALKMSINFMVWLWSTVSLLASVWVSMLHSVRTCACSALSKPIAAPSAGQLSRFFGCTACPTMWLNPRCSLKTLLPNLLFLCRPPCLMQHITCQVLRLDGKPGVEASHVRLNVTLNIQVTLWGLMVISRCYITCQSILNFSFNTYTFRWPTSNARMDINLSQLINQHRNGQLCWKRLFSMRERQK